MPPYVPRKRARSPAAEAAPCSSTKTSSKGQRSSKAAVLHEVDLGRTPPSTEATRKLLDQLNRSDDSSLSDASDDGSQQPASRPQKRRKVEATTHARKVSYADDDSKSGDSISAEEQDGEENEWDDFIASHAQKDDQEDGVAGEEQANLELTLDRAPQHTRVSLDPSNGKKKGPSKIERAIRTATHCLHVQSLMYHNFIRNTWCNNKRIHSVLTDTLPEGSKREVEKWRAACDKVLGKEAQKERAEEPRSAEKGKGKKLDKKADKKSKGQRDWAEGADAPEDDDSNHGHGDPTFRLLQHLTNFWRQKFVVTAPGLRKQGYKTMERLQDEGAAWRDADADDDNFGEHLASIKDFERQAKKAQGSRDLGAQFFVALLRGLGMEVRLVSNLQPAGFGWSKAEDADPAKKAPAKTAKAKMEDQTPSKAKATAKSPAKTSKAKPTPSRNQPKRAEKKRSGGAKHAPIDLSDEDSSLSSPPASDREASVVDVTFTRPIESVKKYDRDLPFPVYWTEVLSPLTNTWIPVDPIVLKVISSKAETHSAFEPRGAQADRAKQVLAYVVAFSADNTAKDVTTRYLKKHMWPGKTKGTRLPIEKIPIYNKNGKIRKHEEYDWFQDVMRGYTRPDKKRTKADELEEAHELKPVRVQRDAAKKDGEETLQGYKNSADFVLERHLRREEALLPGAKPARTFWSGKGEAAKGEPVYRRDDVVVCRTVESWHKEGREVKAGEQPLKHVPVRAVTTIRKREIEENERETGEKMKQGLYSYEQCDWIIPPPIENGIIPKNAFGNMDVYVPTMVPKGAVHVPLKGAARVCRKLGIEHAEACTGFEFGNRRAVPVLTGVVVANENKKLLVDAWRAEEVEKRKKEEVKREKLVLGMWKKLLAGLRVVERVRREYGDDEVMVEKAVKAETNKKGGKKSTTVKKGKSTGDGDEPVDLTIDLDDELDETSIKHHDPVGAGAELLGGGFFPEGMDVELVHREPAAAEDEDIGGGGFILDHGDEPTDAVKPDLQNTPLSMTSMRQRVQKGSASESIDGTKDKLPSLPSPVSELKHADEMDLDDESEEDEKSNLQRSKYFESSDGEVKDEDQSSDEEPVAKKKKKTTKAKASPGKGRGRGRGRSTAGAGRAAAGRGKA